jgi:hypothetical protein
MEDIASNSSNPSDQETGWNCTACTFINTDMAAAACQVCGTAKAADYPGAAAPVHGKRAAVRSASSDASFLHASGNAKKVKVDERETKECAATLADGFLVQTAKYVKQRVQSLSSFCIICDETHAWGGGLVPTCCTRFVCTELFNKYGKGRAAADGVRCAFSGRNLHLSMPSVPTPARLKRAGV